jgi:hypothetical protein
MPNNGDRATFSVAVLSSHAGDVHADCVMRRGIGFVDLARGVCHSARTDGKAQQ